MVSRKNIILAAFLISLSGSVVFASSANSLLKMDIKKSQVNDTVDVTFYTTGGSTNSVVSRKSDNRYVVLLPNVEGSPSVAPNIGGVKDLVTDIDVKNVDDGIGGYTKVTFTTAKPVKIQTFMKKTEPLTKAQEEYKALIAQNNSKPATSAQPAAKPPVATKTTPAPKNVEQKKPTSKPVEKTIQKQVEQKINSVQNKISNTVNSVKPAISKIEQPKSQQQITPKKTEAKPIQPAAKTEDTYRPQMKFDENGKRLIDLEPRVDHRVKKQETPAPVIADVASPTVVQDVPKPVQEPEKQNKFPKWTLASILGLLAILGLAKSGKKESKPVVSFVPSAEAVQKQATKVKYQSIMHDNNINWQEKYNRFTEANQAVNPSAIKSELSYITNTSATKKAIIEDKPAYKVNKIKQEDTPVINDLPKKYSPKKPEMMNFRSLVKGINEASNRKDEKIKEDLRTKISQMEHSLSQTPSMESEIEYKKDVHSEDDSIIKNISKLKSFANNKSLKSSHRMLLGAERRHLQDKDIKEGRFVKLKNSPLNISMRKSASSQINSKDNYFNNYGEMDMAKQNDNYSSTSLNEYLSILDREEKNSNVAPVVAGTVSNPMKVGRASSNTMSMNGMVVRSGYSIDSEKGFYLVEMDGASAIVGRTKDNIVVLKRFDGIVEGNLQVRRDHDSVYIVKAGGFKCLVDVSKDKMGTLLEI
ncbi:hypothetical protein IJ579_07705 [bacterium]|nr:hypothetical protein [bacterium]